MPIGVM